MKMFLPKKICGVVQIVLLLSNSAAANVTHLSNCYTYVCAAASTHVLWLLQTRNGDCNAQQLRQ